MLCTACAGSGSASAEEYGTKDEAVAMVKRAIARVNDVGFDVAKVEFMDPSRGRYGGHPGGAWPQPEGGWQEPRGCS
jgi:hypothetical protein